MFKSFKCPTLPRVRKCCFCVPIRRGITIFGYVNLTFGLLTLPFLIYMYVEQETLENNVEPFGQIALTTHVPLTIAFSVFDIVMTIVLLIGAHKKKKRLLQIYFYVGGVSQLMTFCVDLVYSDFQDYLENTAFVIILCLNVYLLFLVYNTIQVIEEHSEVQYMVYQQQRQSV